jgi:hypothetical protein
MATTPDPEYFSSFHRSRHKLVRRPFVLLWGNFKEIHLWLCNPLCVDQLMVTWLIERFLAACPQLRAYSGLSHTAQGEHQLHRAGNFQLTLSFISGMRSMRRKYMAFHVNQEFICLRCWLICSSSSLARMT